MNEREFWITVRRSILMLASAVDKRMGGNESEPLRDVADEIERRHGLNRPA